MAMVYEFQGLVPVIHPSAYVHPTAVLIGDVIIGPNCFVAPNTSLRGDFGRLILEEGVNFQDNCVMHGLPEGDTVIEAFGHIGHGAIIHGARIKRNVLVGMSAVVMDAAVIGEDSVVAACAFVKAGSVVPPRSLVAGVPAKKLRDITEKDLMWKTMMTAPYLELAKIAPGQLKAAEPLSAPEPNRPRTAMSKQLAEAFPHGANVKS
ncbi:MAG: phenylacetic acid degradation protein PaaY [Alphaproteobacteria bacterium]